MHGKIDNDLKAIVWVTLQAVIGLIVTLNLALQAWTLTTIYDLSMVTRETSTQVTEHSRRLESHANAIKDNRTSIYDHEGRLKSLEVRKVVSGLFKTVGF